MNAEWKFKAYCSSLASSLGSCHCLLPMVSSAVHMNSAMLSDREKRRASLMLSQYYYSGISREILGWGEGDGLNLIAGEQLLKPEHRKVQLELSIYNSVLVLFRTFAVVVGISKFAHCTSVNFSSVLLTITFMNTPNSLKIAWKGVSRILCYNNSLVSLYTPNQPLALWE